MKRILLSLLMVALSYSVACPVQAKEEAPIGGAQNGAKPVLVISVSGYDKVLNDVGFMGRLAQQPGLDEQVKAMVTLFTQGQGLNGLDKKRPWGIVLNFNGDFLPLGFLPVSDTKALLDSLAQWVGPAEPSAAGKGILEVQKPRQRWFIKEQNGWAFFSPKPDNLDDLPADPTKLLDGLDKQYEVGIRLYVNNIPKMLRDMGVDYLRQINEMQLRNLDEATREKTRSMSDKQMKAFAEAINSIDQFTIGWAIDPSAGTSHLDVAWTVLADTPLAKKLNALKDTTSNYTGFMLPKAAVTVNNSHTLFGDDIERAAQQIDVFQSRLETEIENSPDLQDDDSRAAAKRIIGEAIAAFKATVQSGKTDFGGSWLVADRQFSLFVGGYIKEPADLEKAFKDLIEVAKKDPNFPATKFVESKEGDIRLYTWTSQIPADDKVNRAIGKELKGVAGFGSESVYFALSTQDPLPVLKKAIADSKAAATKKVSPVVIDVALQPILNFVSVLAPDDDNVAAQVAEIAKTPGKDHIHVEVLSAPNGGTFRLALQEGALKVLGLAAKLQYLKQQGDSQ